MTGLQEQMDKMSSEKWRYAIVRLPAHLAKAGRQKELERLLLDFNWMRTKLDATDITALTNDYNFLRDNRSGQLVQDTLRMSSHIISRDKAQLTGQVLGRIRTERGGRLGTLLREMREHATSPRLIPLRASLPAAEGPAVRTLEGHDDYVHTVAVSLDGKYVVSGSEDKTVRVWELSTGRQVRRLAGHDGPVVAVAITPDNRYVVSAEDSIVRVWDRSDGRLIRSITVWGVKCMTLTPEGKHILCGLGRYDEHIEVFDLISDEPAKFLFDRTGYANAIAVTLDGCQVIAGSADKTVKVWDFRTAKLLRCMAGHSEPVVAVTVTPDNRFVVSASKVRHPGLRESRGELRVWDLASGKSIHAMECSGVKSIALTPDSRTAVLACRYRVVRLFDLIRGEMLGTFEGHASAPQAVAVTTDGQYAISCSLDRTIKVWDLRRGSLRGSTVEQRRVKVRALSITPDGMCAVSGHTDGMLRLWELKTGREMRRIKGHSDWVTTTALTSDGLFLISGSRDGALGVWNILRGGKKYRLDQDRGEINTVAVTPDNGVAVCGYNDGTLVAWDLMTGKQKCTMLGHKGPVSQVVTTPDSNCAVSASEDRTLRVWHLSTGQNIHILRGHSHSVRALMLTPNGRLAISGSRDSTIRIWEVATGKPHECLKGHTCTIEGLAITPDNRHLVSSGSADNTILVWELAHSRLVRSLSGHSRMVWCIAITPNGRHVVSSSVDRTVKVWDLSDGKVVAEFSGDREFSCLAISPDGRTIVTSDEGGQMHFLRLEGLEDMNK